MEDSIVFRLLHALLSAERLDTQDPSVECEWANFFNSEEFNVTINGPNDIDITFLGDPMDAIRWEKIILGGWSQGSGMAALISLEHEVGGLFLLEGPSDVCLEVPGDLETGRPATYIAALVDDPAAWPSAGAPKFGVWHRVCEDGECLPEELPPGGAGDNRPILWDNDYPNHNQNNWLRGLRLEICQDQDWDNTVEVVGDQFPPLRLYDVDDDLFLGIDAFRGSTIVTMQEPPSGGCAPHGSVAVSSSIEGEETCMPKDAIGGEVAETAGEAHLFGAYVQAFCAMDVP